jgi:hypothetical protein
MDSTRLFSRTVKLVPAKVSLCLAFLALIRDWKVRDPYSCFIILSFPAGIIPRACKLLFELINKQRELVEELTVKCSFLGTTRIFVAITNRVSFRNLQRGRERSTNSSELKFKDS